MREHSKPFRNRRLVGNSWRWLYPSHQEREPLHSLPGEKIHTFYIFGSLGKGDARLLKPLIVSYRRVIPQNCWTPFKNVNQFLTLQKCSSQDKTLPRMRRGPSHLAGAVVVVSVGDAGCTWKTAGCACWWIRHWVWEKERSQERLKRFGLRNWKCGVSINWCWEGWEWFRKSGVQCWPSWMWDAC